MKKIMTNEVSDAIPWALKLEAKKSGCTVDELTERILSDWLVGKGYFMIY